MNRTALYDWHISRGATMTRFREWEMPLWYPTGAVAEHRSVITHAGLFDTSHMSVVSITGPGAFHLLQKCFTRDLTAYQRRGSAGMEPGRSAFGAYLNEAGWVVDDTILYHVDSDTYLSIVNAGMGKTIATHLREQAESLQVEIVDLTGKVGKIDVQGRTSARILSGVLKDPDRVLSDMTYFAFKGHFDDKSRKAEILLADGTSVLLSRTGYTGEFGFEILMAPDRLVEAWELILRSGQEHGLTPCGLAARDSLRCGAMLPLSQQDIGPWPFVNHPWSHALPYNVDGSGFTKSFLGDSALLDREDAEHTYAIVGNDPRKVSVKDPAAVIGPDGEETGVVLTSVADMAIGRHRDRVYSMASPDRPEGFKPKGLMCGFIRTKSKLSIGDVVALRDAKRTIKASVVDDIRPDRTAGHPMREMLRR